MSDARSAAARAIEQMLGGHALDRALLAQSIAPRQRPLAQALAYTCARHLGSNQALLQRLLSQPKRPRPAALDAVVLCGLSELRFLASKQHAAVAESVAAAKRLGLTRQSGLINALLRRYLREREQLESQLAGDPVARFEHPRWWMARLRADWPQHAERILQASNQRAPLWLRVNAGVADRAGMLERISAAGLQGQGHPELVDALRVDPPLPVEQLPGFAEGLLSVQDAAAQRVADWVQPQPGQRILDACAAPGGKTAHLLERCPQASVHAIDVDPQRLQRVEENLNRLQLSAQLLCADAADTERWWDGQRFDRILIDAPCTGSGVVRRHPDIKWLRRDSDPEQLAQTQLQLLQRLWPLLAPGGRLVYTTCSVFRAENDGVMARFVDELQRSEPGQAQLWRPTGASGELPHGIQVLPGDNDEDGFYYAAVERAPVR